MIHDEWAFRAADVGDAAALTAFFTRNRAHLAPWEPTRPDAFFTVDEQHERLKLARLEHVAGRSYRWHVVDREGQVIAMFALGRVERGARWSAELGFAVDAAIQGRGLATAGVAEVTRWADSIGISRLSAAYLPENIGSSVVLARSGFRVEGFAKEYAEIHGRWRDHVVCSRLARPPAL